MSPSPGYLYAGWGLLFKKMSREDLGKKEGIRNRVWALTRNKLLTVVAKNFLLDENTEAFFFSKFVDSLTRLTREYIPPASRRNPFFNSFNRRRGQLSI